MANQEQPNEEDLSLTGPAPRPSGGSKPPKDQSQAAAPTTDEQPEEGRLIGARMAHIPIAVGASDQDVLNSVLQAPTDAIFQWETCELPSGGRFYGWPDGVVRVRPMSQQAEMALATQRLAATGESIDYLFRACCQFPNSFDR